ncbi:MAG: PIN domain-containing protein [Candidatus Micrarchaeota archaeon]|nr:PIN domain-containing protein [Candidatus Micrarchaeota archaeon]
MILDTSAWVEFFEGTTKGEKVKDILEKDKCFTSMVSLAEITNWSLKYGRETAYFIDTMTKLSTILNIDKEIAVLAGRLNFERKKLNKKWGMLDSLIAATSIAYNLRLLAKDPDYDDLPNVVIL